MASSVRRRKTRDGKRSHSRSSSVASQDDELPATPEDPDKAEDLALVPVPSLSKLSRHKTAPKTKGVKRRTGFIFFLGGLFGIVIAGFFAQQNDLIEFPEFGDLNLESLMDVLPAGFLQDAKELKVRIHLFQSSGKFLRCS
jgi:phospholipid:diacylglycerol acyltransferase